MQVYLLALVLLGTVVLAVPVPRSDSGAYGDPDCEDEYSDGVDEQEPIFPDNEVDLGDTDHGLMGPNLTIDLEDDSGDIDGDCEEEDYNGTDGVDTQPCDGDECFDGAKSPEEECLGTNCPCTGPDCDAEGCDGIKCDIDECAEDPCAEGCEQDCAVCDHLPKCAPVVILTTVETGTETCETVTAEGVEATGEADCASDPCNPGCEQSCGECGHLPKCQVITLDPCENNPCGDGCASRSDSSHCIDTAIGAAGGDNGYKRGGQFGGDNGGEDSSNDPNDSAASGGDSIGDDNKCGDNPCQDVCKEYNFAHGLECPDPCFYKPALCENEWKPADPCEEDPCLCNPDLDGCTALDACEADICSDGCAQPCDQCGHLAQCENDSVTPTCEDPDILGVEATVANSPDHPCVGNPCSDGCADYARELGTNCAKKSETNCAGGNCANPIIKDFEIEPAETDSVMINPHDFGDQVDIPFQGDEECEEEEY